MSICEYSAPDRARIILVDYRRTMLGVVGEAHLGGYSTTSKTCGPMIGELATYLSRRLPDSEITPRQLRERSWWTGPEIYVLVDDYDMVVTGGGGVNPLQPLVEYLPQARDIGMHLIVARRTGGVSRALFDNVLGTLKNLSAATIIGSGSSDEGKLVGDVRPTKLPAGRGVLVSRSRGQEMIQIADLPPL